MTSPNIKCYFLLSIGPLGGLGTIESGKEMKKLQRRINIKGAVNVAYWGTIKKLARGPQQQIKMEGEVFAL